MVSQISATVAPPGPAAHTACRISYWAGVSFPSGSATRPPWNRLVWGSTTSVVNRTMTTDVVKSESDFFCESRRSYRVAEGPVSGSRLETHLRHPENGLSRGGRV